MAVTTCGTEKRQFRSYYYQFEKFTCGFVAHVNLSYEFFMLFVVEIDIKENIYGNL